MTLFRKNNTNFQRIYKVLKIGRCRSSFWIFLTLCLKHVNIESFSLQPHFSPPGMFCYLRISCKRWTLMLRLYFLPTKSVGQYAQLPGFLLGGKWPFIVWWHVSIVSVQADLLPVHTHSPSSLPWGSHQRLENLASINALQPQNICKVWGSCISLSDFILSEP